MDNVYIIKKHILNAVKSRKVVPVTIYHEVFGSLRPVVFLCFGVLYNGVIVTELVKAETRRGRIIIS